MPDYSIFFDSAEELAQYMALDPDQQAAYIRILARTQGIDKSCIECKVHAEQQESKDASAVSAT